MNEKTRILSAPVTDDSSFPPVVDATWVRQRLRAMRVVPRVEPEQAPAPESETGRWIFAAAIPIVAMVLAIALLNGCAQPPMDTGRVTPAPDGEDPKLPPAASDDAGMTAPPPPMVDGGVLEVVDSGTPPSAPQPPGSACNCDADCEDDGTHEGICVRGICMTRASGACSSSGSSAECGEGSRCWRARDTSTYVCFPDCASYTCAGRCDGDGSCVDTTGMGCDSRCGTVCPTPPAPPPAPPPPGGDTCPDWRCTTGCTELVQLPGSSDSTSEESLRRGYFIDTRPEYTWLRRDLVLLLQYAACRVAARFPGTRPIGISDLSQRDGRTPGTDRGDPRHPTTTHRGNDLDLAYYQTDAENDTQIVCGDGSDRNGNGTRGAYNDGYFCTTETNIVDWPRQAYFFGMLATSPLVRVFGIDQTMPDDFREHLRLLHDAGDLDDGQYERALELGYGSSGGWQFHHHHTHMSYRLP